MLAWGTMLVWGQSNREVAMSILGDLRAVAAKLSHQDNPPICAFCGKGKLVLIDERPDRNFGALGVVEQTLRCDAADCGKLTID
ncbi:MAG: hypothetical protein GEV13_00430 [Rhodospirillales bacterium]|nr:hypothetical protein [Rhodospirillales bacterium]